MTIPNASPIMLLPLFSLALAAAQEAPAVRSTFEKDESGWIAVQALGTGGKVAAVHERESLKIGAGSLRLDYTVGQGQIAGAALPIVVGTVAKMESLHFWIRTPEDVPLTVTVQEKDGGQYLAMFTSPKDRWQEVEIGVRDFTPSTDANAPVDPNGRLDPAQIESITVLDLAQFIAQAPPLAALLGVKTGFRSVLLSDFQVTTKSLPDASLASDAAYLFDTYVRPQPGWAALNATARIVSEAPLDAPSLRLETNLASDKAAGAFRRIRPGSLVGKKTLKVRLASLHDAKLIVQVEERGGAKYNATLSIPGGSKAVERTVHFSDMAPDAQSKDENGKLDLDPVVQINLVDVTAITEAPGMNTLWVGEIKATP